MRSLARRLAFILLATPLFAQQPPPTGTVTGHVICADTQRPARFAHVTLFSVPKQIQYPPKLDSETDAAQINKAFQAAARTVSVLQTQTTLDGSFTALGVAPGDYYVFASVPGYLSASAILRAALDGGADPYQPVPGITIVRVLPDRAVQGNVVLEHGATVAGRVLWDDGSPALQTWVTVLPAAHKSKPVPLEFSMVSMGNMPDSGPGAMTDDLGRFRIVGLTPGDYIVQATLTTRTRFAMQSGSIDQRGMSATSSLDIYAPSAFHRSAAKPVTLHAAEERSDQEITINLSNLHSITGQLASVEDHHPLNSANIKLSDMQDPDFVRHTGVDIDGTFTLEFVPPGTYELAITDAADTEPSKKPKTGPFLFTGQDTVRSYVDAKRSIVITDADLTRQNLELTPAKVLKKSFDALDPDTN